MLYNMLMDESQSHALVEWKSGSTLAPNLAARVLKVLKRSLIAALIAFVAMAALSTYLTIVIDSVTVAYIAWAMTFLVFMGFYIDLLRIIHFKKGSFSWCHSTVDELVGDDEADANVWVICSDVKAFSLDGALRRGTGVALISYRDMSAFMGRSFVLIDNISMVKG